MAYLFKTFLYHPLEQALVWLYNTVAFHDLGLAIILLTVAVRIVLYPLFYKAFKNQTMMQKIQPHIKQIQHDHKENKEKQAQALMALYKEHNINPFSGFLMLLVQLPILIALYKLFVSGIPAELNPISFGLLNLQTRNIVMIGLAAIAQYFQGRLSLPPNIKTDDSTTSRVARQMVFMGPVLTLVILYTTPAAVGLYWLVSSIFSLGQQIIINKHVAHHGESQTNSSKNA